MNIPASLMKQLPGMTTYLPMEKSSICQIGKKVSSTVTSHYYKGLSNHLDNLVIVITENREQRTENREQRTENYSNSIYYGNYYGLHDGYDGSVFCIYGICKTITASIGGIASILVK